MSQKGNALIIGILIGLLIAGGLFGAYYLGTSKNIQSKQSTDLPSLSQITPQSTKTSQDSITAGADETDGWKTYTSKYGYSFKYPATLRVKDFSDLSTSSKQSPIKESIAINKEDSSDGDFLNNVNNWISVCSRSESNECGRVSNTSVITVNGYQALQQSGIRDISFVRDIYLSQGDYVYNITLDDGDPEKLELQQLNNQILSTFKFL